jgi:trans-aconitate methyltransferase
MTNADWNPDTYLDQMLAEIPSYLNLQEEVARATEGLDVSRVLELGVGTAETARRILERHPNATWTAIDASEAMLGRARYPTPICASAGSKIRSRTGRSISSCRRSSSTT